MKHFFKGVLVSILLLASTALLPSTNVESQSFNINIEDRDLSSLQGFFTHPAPGTSFSREFEYNHDGLDLGGSYNDPILASADGEVFYTQKTLHKSGGYGFYLILKHKSGLGDLYTLYAHLSQPTQLNVGDSVNQGQNIGLMGETGQSFGVHLHFAIFSDMYLVNGALKHHPSCLTQYGKYAGTCIRPLDSHIAVTSYIAGEARTNYDTINPAFTASSIIDLQTINTNQELTYTKLQEVLIELFDDCGSNTQCTAQTNNLRMGVTRGEFSKLLIQAIRKNKTGRSNLPNSIRFSSIDDVSRTNKHHTYIQRALFSNLMELDDKMFSPDDYITRAEAAESFIKASELIN